MRPQGIERLLIGILIVITAGIVVHTPLSVWTGTIWPSADLLIKSWKELLMGMALLLLIVTAKRRDKVGALLSDRLMQIALVYAGLHFLLLAFFQNGFEAVGAGLLIDLRYLLFFVLVYGTLTLFPQYRKLFISVFVGGAVIVIGFAVLQLLVLPRDVLAHIGYSKATISPYLTVDENPLYTRINSTLRGPNPLGAYATIFAGLLLAVGAKWKLGRKGWAMAVIGAIALGMALGASHSRSSIIGAVVAVLVIVALSATKKVRRWFIGGAMIAIIITATAIYVFRDSSFVANVILHNNPTSGATVDSNEGHAASLFEGTSRMFMQPFGAGIGSTGSASLLGDKPVIIENQYLLIAHETGWAGLVLFVWLFLVIMTKLWHRRSSALALGVFGGGVGLAIIGMLLPVWTDDTVSIVWWGLAAVAIATTKTVKAKRKAYAPTKSH